jgi:hypothetical protein
MLLKSIRRACVIVHVFIVATPERADDDTLSKSRPSSSKVIPRTICHHLSHCFISPPMFSLSRVSLLPCFHSTAHSSWRSIAWLITYRVNAIALCPRRPFLSWDDEEEDDIHFPITERRAMTEVVRELLLHRTVKKSKKQLKSAPQTEGLRRSQRLKDAQG